MQLILDQWTSPTPGMLADAWETGTSFVIAPSPLPVDRAWLEQAIAHLPTQLRSGHFGILTSGSTGTPKLVIGEQQRTHSMAVEIGRRQQLDVVHDVVLALPLAYSYSLVNQWLWAHLAGRPLVRTRGLADPVGLFAPLAAARDAMLCLVGSQVALLRRHLTPGTRFPGIVRINFAGGPFPQADLPWLSEAFPNAQVFHNYGCTEALPRLTIRKAAEHPDPMVLGRPLDGVSLRLGAGGELQFRSPYAAVAMVDRDGVQHLAQGQWLDTGDLAEPVGDGDFRLLGRANEVFKRHGEKVSLPAVRACVRDTWHGDCATYVEPAPDGEAGYVLVLSPPADAAAARAVLLHLRQHFRRPHWPIRVEAVDYIPLSPNGKTDAMALQATPRTVVWKQMM